MRIYRKPYESARSKRRHPCEKGSIVERAWREVVARLSDHRFWAKHPEPFNKTTRGNERRKEKRFRRAFKEVVIERG